MCNPGKRPCVSTQKLPTLHTIYPASCTCTYSPSPIMIGVLPAMFFRASRLRKPPTRPGLAAPGPGAPAARSVSLAHVRPLHHLAQLGAFAVALASANDSLQRSAWFSALEAALPTWPLLGPFLCGNLGANKCNSECNLGLCQCALKHGFSLAVRCPARAPFNAATQIYVPKQDPSKTRF